MTSSSYDRTSLLIPNRASGYEPGVLGVQNASFLSTTQPYAAGSLPSTVADLNTWYQASERRTRGEAGGVIPLVETKASMPDSSSTRSVSIHRFSGGESSQVEDILAVEEPLQIRLSEGGRARSLAITMRTPGRDADLALGFLFTEGIVRDPAEVTSVEVGNAKDKNNRNTVTVSLSVGCTVDWAKLQRHGYTSSSCGVCGKTSLEQVEAVLPFGELPGSWTVASSIIPGLPDTLRASQELFEQTGGIHAAGLFSAAGELLHFAEDVGRHNALDKVIGHAFQSDWLPLRERILVLSGRASFELIQKAAMAGISFVVAVGAPSSLAVELACEQSITLCGFTRGRGFNGYSHQARIVK